MRVELMISAPPQAGGVALLHPLDAALRDLTLCAMACTFCADACLAGATVDRMRQCIRLCLDCADLCAVAARLALRRTGVNDTLLAEVLAVCCTACHQCGNECQRHAARHDHCRLCTDACLACGTACQRAIGDIA